MPHVYIFCNYLTDHVSLTFERGMQTDFWRYWDMIHSGHFDIDSFEAYIYWLKEIVLTANDWNFLMRGREPSNYFVRTWKNWMASNFKHLCCYDILMGF